MGPEQVRQESLRAVAISHFSHESDGMNAI